MNRKPCFTCKQHKPVQYYVRNWQKAYAFPLGFPYCDDCARQKEDLTLYKDWIAVLDAPKNDAVLS